MSKKKDGPSACMFNNKLIYLIGGWLNYWYLDDFEKYDINNDTWKNVHIASSKILPPRCNALIF